MGFDRLIDKIKETGNPSVVGLDPKLDYVPAYLRKKFQDEDGCTLQAAARAIFAFNKAIINEICDIVCSSDSKRVEAFHLFKVSFKVFILNRSVMNLKARVNESRVYGVYAN